MISLFELTAGVPKPRQVQWLAGGTTGQQRVTGRYFVQSRDTKQSRHRKMHVSELWGNQGPASRSLSQ